MTTVPPKHHHHQPLHNFSLPFLKWGHRIQSNSPPSDSDRPRNRRTSRQNAVIEKQNTKPPDDGDIKPWNLRPRRLTIDDGNGNGVNEKEKEDATRKELWISLSKEEIEEDVYAFTGSRPARRPKKRNRTVQKQVDNVFPGLYLVGVSAESYRV